MDPIDGFRMPSTMLQRQGTCYKAGSISAAQKCLGWIVAVMIFLNAELHEDDPTSLGDDTALRIPRKRGKANGPVVCSQSPVVNLMRRNAIVLIEVLSIAPGSSVKWILPNIRNE